MKPLLKKLKVIDEKLETGIKCFPHIEQEVSGGATMVCLELIASTFKEVTKERDDALRERDNAQKVVEPLRKRISAEDQLIDEHESALSQTREMHGAREEKLRKENERLEPEKSSLKAKLEYALKEPDKIKEELNRKLQRRHEKIRFLEQ